MVQFAPFCDPALALTALQPQDLPSVLRAHNSRSCLRALALAVSPPGGSRLLLIIGISVQMSPAQGGLGRPRRRWGVGEFSPSTSLRGTLLLTSVSNF